MTPVDVWSAKIETLCEQYAGALMTVRELEEVVRSAMAGADSPVNGVQCHIGAKAPFQELVIGIQGEGEASDQFTHAAADPRGTSFRIRLWSKPAIVAERGYLGIARANEQLLKLIRCSWRPELRDDKSASLSLQYQQTYDLLENSLLRLLRRRGMLAVCFSDLDKFKLINDSLGMAEGDRVILHYAAILERCVLPDGIVLHRSGDEFVILQPIKAAEDVLELIHRVADEVSHYEWEVGDLRPSTSVGIALVRHDAELAPYKELERRAEKVVKPGGGVKHRDRARFEKLAGESPPRADDFWRDLAACVVKAQVGANAPFASPWLNQVSREVVKLLDEREPSAESISGVRNVLEWVKPNWTFSTVRSALASEVADDLAADFSPLDVGLAVAHGVFRAGLTRSSEDRDVEVRYSTQSPSFGIYLTGPDPEVALLEYGVRGQATDVLKLGGFFGADSEQSRPEDARYAVVVKIGHEKLRTPAGIFGDVIVVDDRPTRGGGLPDFWEATVARLVMQLERDPNIDIVYVIGDARYGAKTVEKLAQVESWEAQAEATSYKTGMSIQSIQAASRRLAGRVAFPTNEEELVSAFARLLRQGRLVKPVAQALTPRAQGRFLRRELRIDRMALSQEDGCKVDTAAEAFPVVLEIARNASSEATIRDQAGQELRELIDFKVHVKDPARDQVPAFYRDEEASLEEYFRREFSGAEGLFGRRFIETRQLDSVLTHVASVIADRRRRFATRRAILVVPHEIRDGEDLAPLGLVSVRIVPRFLQSRVRLYYSYTWRTVEALVGFPYSLYGSLKFSQYLTDQIRHRLEPEYARQVELAEVSYIAHSLHMFMDDHGQGIARRIIDDASI